MSIVTLDAGSKQLLRCVANVLCAETGNTANIETILGSIENLLTGQLLQEGYNYVAPGSNGSTAGFESYSIQNIGMTNALVDGQIFPPGAIFEPAGEKGDTFTGVFYDSQATTLIVATVLR